MSHKAEIDKELLERGCRLVREGKITQNKLPKMWGYSINTCRRILQENNSMPPKKEKVVIPPGAIAEGIEKYKQCKVSVEGLIKQWGVDRKRVHKILKDHDVEIRHTAQKNVVDRELLKDGILGYINKKYVLEDLSKMWKVTVPTAKAICEREAEGIYKDVLTQQLIEKGYGYIFEGGSKDGKQE